MTSPTPVRSIYALVREGVADTPAVRTVLRVLTRLGARAAGRPAGWRAAERAMIRAGRGWAAATVAVSVVGVLIELGVVIAGMSTVT